MPTNPSIAPNDRYREVVATADGQAVFTTDFPLYSADGVEVRLNGTLLTLTLQYAVTNLEIAGGATITLVPAVAALVEEDHVVTLTGSTPVQRTQKFSQAGDWNSYAFNKEFDLLIMILQEIQAADTNFAAALATETAARIAADLVLQDAIDAIPGGGGGGGGGVVAYREVTAAGAITVLVDDGIIGVNKAIGAATTVNLGLAADRDGAPITIKDVKGDAATNNITPVFSGGELCDGLGAANFVISNNYGWITFHPRAGGWFTI